MLRDELYKKFVATKGQEKYDVSKEYTLGIGVNEIFKDCYLSLKTKQVSSQGNQFAGYVETGKALTLLDSLLDVVMNKLGHHGFKMVLESYLPIRDDSGKLLAIEGQKRNVYNIKDNIGRILGNYSNAERLQKLIDSVKGFNQRGSSILNDSSLSIHKRCHLLDELKTDINDFSEKMLRNRCLVRLDVKESSECRTFTHVVVQKNKKAKIPQYRVASSLDVRQLPKEGEGELEAASPITFDSPPETGSKKNGIHAQWSRRVGTFPPSRSQRDPREKQRLLAKFKSSAKPSARSESARSESARSASSAKPSARSESARGASARSASARGASARSASSAKLSARSESARGASARSASARGASASSRPRKKEMSPALSPLEEEEESLYTMPSTSSGQMSKKRTSEPVKYFREFPSPTSRLPKTPKEDKGTNE